MANQDIGYISRAEYARHLPEQIPIRKSGREGARYPLYVSLPWGPGHMNTAAAQNILLEHGHINGPAPANDPAPAEAPGPAPAPVMDQAPVPESVKVDQEAANQAEPSRKKSFFDMEIF